MRGSPAARAATRRRTTDVSSGVAEGFFRSAAASTQTVARICASVGKVWPVRGHVRMRRAPLGTFFGVVIVSIQGETPNCH